jgi:hypothetical protein
MHATRFFLPLLCVGGLVRPAAWRQLDETNGGNASLAAGIAAKAMEAVADLAAKFSK